MHGGGPETGNVIRLPVGQDVLYVAEELALEACWGSHDALSAVGPRPRTGCYTRDGQSTNFTWRGWQ